MPSEVVLTSRRGAASAVGALVPVDAADGGAEIGGERFGARSAVRLARRISRRAGVEQRHDDRARGAAGAEHHAPGRLGAPAGRALAQVRDEAEAVGVAAVDGAVLAEATGC